jgi:hypothetical protein
VSGFLAYENKIVSHTLGIDENRFVHWQWCALHGLKNTDTRDAALLCMLCHDV